MLAGCGIQGGMIYGSTDNQAAYVKENPVFPEDFSATLFEALGVPPNTRYGPDGFAFQVSSGQPVRALFG